MYPLRVADARVNPAKISFIARLESGPAQTPSPWEAFGGPDFSDWLLKFWAKCGMVFQGMRRPDLRYVGPGCWELPRQGNMKSAARIYATEEMLDSVYEDRVHMQLANVASLPGIVGPAMAMPDFHWGYGFPIGGVAAFDLDEGVISPGGVGYDINCGVRLLATGLELKEVNRRLRELVEQLFRDVPTGVGSSGVLSVSQRELEDVVRQGARWAVGRGYGSESDLEFIEEGGMMRETNVEAVTPRSWKRGKEQLGTLGSGNHFLEIGYVDEVYDFKAAEAFGLRENQVTLMVHCGSRGFGYQICDDYLKEMAHTGEKYGIEIPERQLVCAPFKSEEGQAYFHAMNCAVNYAFANRQVIASLAGRALKKALGLSDAELGLRTVYEVAHNIAKVETHTYEEQSRRLCVHRKGATRAFAAGHEEVPSRYRAIGQPVLVPGDMGRASYVVCGTEKAMKSTFGSSCHGAGRRMSRTRAEKSAHGRDIAAELLKRGVVVRGQSRKTLAEELPEAYKDVSQVVEACKTAGIATKVVRLRPIGCVKG